MANAFCKLSGFPVAMHQKNGKVRITVKHTLGKKYSLYVAGVISGKIEQLTKKKAEVSSTANTISFSVNVWFYTKNEKFMEHQFEIHHNKMYISL